MPSILVPISPIGPTLDVGLSLPASLVPRSAAQQIYWFKAIADTGCSHTSIHSSVAVKCGLNVLGKDIATTPAGAVTVNLYHGDLYLRSMVSWLSPFDWQFPDRTLVEMIHQNQNFDVLLGMDILNMGVFITNGGTRQATFSW